MNPPPDSPLTPAQRRDEAQAQLEQLEKDLRATRKILARDWEQLPPRERSAHSRRVKEMEQEQQTLRDFLDTADAG